MRIALVCRSYPTEQLGGMPSVTQVRAEALAEEGHEVHVLTTGSSKGLPEVSEREGYTLHHQPCPPKLYTDEFAEVCAATCRRLGPLDILHLDSFDSARPWWADRPGAAKTVAASFHGVHIGWFLTRWNLYLAGRGPLPTFAAAQARDAARAMAQLDRVIGASPHETWQLGDCYNVPHRARCVYNPIPRYFWEGATEAPPAKGYLLCIGAPSTMVHKGFGNVDKLASIYGLAVHHAHNLSRDKLPAIYRGARWLAHPTYYGTGLDLVLAESLAQRRAVIVSGTGSYYHEAQAWPWLRVVRRGDQADLLSAVRSAPPLVPADAADRHRPEAHVAAWLRALA